MYGTIAKLRFKPQRINEIRDLLDEWKRDHRARAEGARDGYLVVPDSERGVAYLIAVFAERESYRRNAESPEQDAWYQRLRKVLDADPEWIDGEFMSV